ncbi:excisionase family DNA binding protein [Anaerobacterium chartisolvens]|uniref:Excisionase family DNA binding protein n=1 Tax=Anaerobacterium chartisolvens TaxID=1297424 RepID=A0A369BKJ8_9FIRM|nr:helix-turn-helix domain-containing protein [Anaerobacterium chartisolvens]RCX21106.1 excisionase family DNA binding protein [Anaerobacterium chartisolvens]
MNSEVYTVYDIMQILNISKNVAYDLVKQKGFPAIRIKSSYRIPKKGFDSWLNDRINRTG